MTRVWVLPKNDLKNLACWFYIGTIQMERNNCIAMSDSNIWNVIVYRTLNRKPLLIVHKIWNSICFNCNRFIRLATGRNTRKRIFLIYSLWIHRFLGSSVFHLSLPFSVWLTVLSFFFGKFLLKHSTYLCFVTILGKKKIERLPIVQWWSTIKLPDINT